MPEQAAFSACHPAVIFLYFTLVLLFSMFLMHPVCLLISLFCAVCCLSVLTRGHGLWRSVAWVLPVVAVTALINPLFNHAGITVLCYLPHGNALTGESLVYGLAAGIMLAAVLVWFQCCSRVLRSDQFVYLFGRIIPALSLVLSMALRLIPRFRAQLKAVSEAQQGLGRDVFKGTLRQRLRTAVTVFSVTLTWALENAIETAQSMKSRGYGLPGRTSFSICRFTRRDRMALAWLLMGGFYVFCASLSGALGFTYYPTLQGAAITPFTVSVFLVYLAVSLTPVFFHWKEAGQWRCLNCAG